jgi:hypothetical protein
MHNQLKMFPVSYYSYKQGDWGGVVTFLLQTFSSSGATIAPQKHNVQPCKGKMSSPVRAQRL